MASNLTVDSISKGATTVNTDEIVDTGSNQIAHCWVAFDATSMTIRSSYNISSITDNGAGDQTVNFGSALSVGHSTISMIAQDNQSGDNGMFTYAYSFTTTSARVGSRTARTSGKSDSSKLSVIIFGEK